MLLKKILITQNQWKEEIDGINTIKPILNINKLIEYYKDKEINAHYLKPNYLKKIDAEDKL